MTDLFIFVSCVVHNYLPHKFCCPATPCYRDEEGTKDITFSKSLNEVLGIRKEKNDLSGEAKNS